MLMKLRNKEHKKQEMIYLNEALNIDFLHTGNTIHKLKLDFNTYSEYLDSNDSIHSDLQGKQSLLPSITKINLEDLQTTTQNGYSKQQKLKHHKLEELKEKKSKKRDYEAACHHLYHLNQKNKEAIRFNVITNLTHNAIYKETYLPKPKYMKTKAKRIICKFSMPKTDISAFAKDIPAMNVTDFDSLITKILN